MWALITYVCHSEVCTYLRSRRPLQYRIELTAKESDQIGFSWTPCLRYKTIEKFYSNPTTYNYGIVYRKIGLDSQAIVITVFIPLRFSIFVLNSQPKLQIISNK